MNVMTRSGFAAALLTATLPTHAAFIHNGFGLANPARTVTFSERALERFTYVTDQFKAFGVEFEPFIRYNTVRTLTYNIDLDNVSNVPLDPRYDAHSIVFTEPQTSAAFAMEASFEGEAFPAVFEFAALLDGREVERVTEPFTTLEADFFGFKEITFDQIRIRQLTAAHSFGWVLDNIETGERGVVPEPALLPVFALAAVMILRTNRR